MSKYTVVLVEKDGATREVHWTDDPKEAELARNTGNKHAAMARRLDEHYEIRMNEE